MVSPLLSREVQMWLAGCHPDPPLAMLEALARGELDVAVAWGPQAGYFARRRHAGLAVTPVVPAPGDDLPLTFDITLGIRWDAAGSPLLGRLNGALRSERAAIERILDDYGIPRL